MSKVTMTTPDEVTWLILCTTPLDRVIVHEAGHRFMWKLMWPGVKTRYGYTGGLPSVIPSNGDIVLTDLTPEAASRHLYVKLAGYASEIKYLGHSDMADKIAEYIASDYYHYCLGGNYRFGWGERPGDDIPCAMSIIGSQSVMTLDVMTVNLVTYLTSCIKNMDMNQREYLAECQASRKFFSKKGHKNERN